MWLAVVSFDIYRRVNIEMIDNDLNELFPKCLSSFPGSVVSILAAIISFTGEILCCFSIFCFVGGVALLVSFVA